MAGMSNINDNSVNN